MKFAFVDIETTGLDPDRHDIWEVALILRDRYVPRDQDDPTARDEYLWQLPVRDLSTADPFALGLSGWWERRHTPIDDPELKPMAYQMDIDEGPHESPTAIRMWGWARRFSQLTRGAWLVGCVPSFDEERLRKLLRRHGACPAWNHHLIDAECYAAGALGLEPPWSSESVRDAIGVVNNDPHTALADARMAEAMYDTARDLATRTAEDF